MCMCEFIVNPECADHYDEYIIETFDYVMTREHRNQITISHRKAYV